MSSLYGRLVFFYAGLVHSIFCMFVKGNLLIVLYLKGDTNQ